MNEGGGVAQDFSNSIKKKQILQERWESLLSYQYIISLLFDNNGNVQ